jgi:hypothetical protein
VTSFLILFRIQSVVDGLQPEKSMPKINNRDLNNWYCDSVETFDLEIPTQEIGDLSPELPTELLRLQRL